VIAQQTVRAIFIAWQHPLTRAYYPVARLVSGVGTRQDLFEFAYIHGAQQAALNGFQPFLAFPDVNTAYRSLELFPFFTNRLMSRNRPDFGAHIQRLGLDADADPMLILARSGGTRATDSIEMFPLPIFDEVIGCYQTYFWMHGFRHLSLQQQARVLALAFNEELTAKPEPSNPKDSNAVQLFSGDNVMVGYIPRYLASDAVHLLKNCSFFKVFVERVNQDPAPFQQRLLCRLESCWPKEFVPCNHDVYKPISQDAVALDPCAGIRVP